MSEKVAIVILNWNNWQHTLDCLESIKANNFDNYFVLLFDNGSNNESVHCLENKTSLIPINEDLLTSSKTVKFKKVYFEALQENLGFSGGCNYGAHRAVQLGASHLFFLNNDAEISPDCLEQLMAQQKINSKCILSACIYDEKEQISFKGSRFPQIIFGKSGLKADPSHQDMIESDYVEGSALLISSEFYLQVYKERSFLFDPQFFLYCEDLDIGLFAKSLGYSCVICTKAVINHKVSSSSGGRGNPISYYYITRNRIYIARRWLPIMWQIIFHFYYILSRLFLVLIRPRAWKIRKSIVLGLMDGYLGRKGKWVLHDEV